MRALGLSQNRDVSMASIMRNVTIISIRSHFTKSSFRSVALAPRLVAMAPTTPMAYKSARPAMSLTTTTKTAGMMAPAISARFGTPNLFSFWKPGGNSPSRDMRY